VANFLLYISMVAFFNSISSTLLPRQSKNTLNFLVLNQAQLRVELYQGLADMVEHDVQLNPT